MCNQFPKITLAYPHEVQAWVIFYLTYTFDLILIFNSLIWFQDPIAPIILFFSIKIIIDGIAEINGKPHFLHKIGLNTSHSKSSAVVSALRLYDLGNTCIKIKIKNHLIAISSCVKYLNVTLDSRLTWTRLIKNLKNHISKMLNALKDIANTTCGSDRSLII